ncbi:MAG: hypothetical protein DRI34_10755 [Deltaproteobacteria bacterium]|nr:MAG: hypothetical protein DRI34_10755 [Deltaproteobacteria bacterium]
MNQVSNVLAIGLLLLGAAGAPAQERSPNTDDACFNDHAGLLNRADQRRLHKLCRRAERDGIAMMLVTVASLDDFRPRPLSIDHFVDTIFNEWDVDYEKGRDAVLLFVSRRENEYRVVMGDAYPDKLRGRAVGVIRRVLVPAARRRHYSSGLRRAMDAIYRRVVKPHVIQKKKEARRRPRRGVMQGP